MTIHLVKVNDILLKLSVVMLCVSLTCSLIVWWADENWTFESQVCTCRICSVPVYTKRAQQSLHLTYKAYGAFPGNGAAPTPLAIPQLFLTVNIFFLHWNYKYFTLPPLKPLDKDLNGVEMFPKKKTLEQLQTTGYSFARITDSYPL